MARIDKETEEKIKNSADIVAVISDFLDLRKRGIEYQCLCPFHDDHTIGNFSINPAKGVYKCFSCGAGGDSVKFLMDYEKLSYGDALRYLAKKFDIYIPDDDADDARWKNIKPAKPREIVEVRKEMLVMPREDVIATMQPRLNTFTEWFRHLPWSNHPSNNQRERVEKTLWLYCVGAWQDGRVCFWQIDNEGRPRGCKLMRYGTDGKRIRTENPGWLYNQPGIRERMDMDHHEFQSSLFGMHLLNKYPQADINIVESEKTALICANARGDFEHHLWMACGGLKHLRIEALKPMIEQGRKVWLWPDKDGVEAWTEKVQEILSDNIRITTLFIEQNWIPEDGEKADVADIYLRHMTKPETYIKRDLKKHTKGPLKAEIARHSDEPFWDPVELSDPRVHEWRERLRLSHRIRLFDPPSEIEGVRTLNEILEEHPLINQLIDIDND